MDLSLELTGCDVKVASDGTLTTEEFVLETESGFNSEEKLNILIETALTDWMKLKVRRNAGRTFSISKPSTSWTVQQET